MVTPGNHFSQLSSNNEPETKQRWVKYEWIQIKLNKYLFQLYLEESKLAI